MISSNEIKTKISGEVSASEEDLKKYSSDASIFEVRPQVVVWPKNAEDLKALVKWAQEAKTKNPSISLTARSAGTDMSGGPLNESVILDFTRHFNKIMEIKQQVQNLSVSSAGGHPALQTDGYAVVEPGVYYRDFEKETLKHNLLLPCFPASRQLCTVGGIAANNSAGEKSLSYGKAENFVEELWAVLSDGNEYSFKAMDENELEKKMKQTNFEGQVYRQMYQLLRENYQNIQNAKPNVTKNSAGYYLWNVWDKRKFDLTKLLVGSQGTLGLITKIKYRLVRPKTKTHMLVIFLKDLAPLGRVVKTVMDYAPETFESFDDHTFSLAVKFLPSMIKSMKGNAFKLAFQFLPELWMTLTGGLPKLVLIAEFTGDSDETILQSIEQLELMLHKQFKLHTHITRSEAETAKYWTVRRESFNLLRQHVKGKHTAPFIDDIVVHPLDLPEFLPQLDAIFKKYPSLVYTIAGHAGDANFHIIPLMDLRDAAERLIIPRLSEEVYNLVLKYKGSITAEHNDGIIRTPFLEKMYGPEIVRLFEKTKEIFDPHGLFNPGKKVGGSLDYAMSHIKKD